MRSIALTAVVLAFLVGGVSAQEQEEGPPPMIAASFYNCAPGQVGPIVDAWSAAFEQLERQGLLLGWGILQHAWGDRWNLVIYRTVPDLVGLQAAMEAQGRALETADPDLNEKFEAACSTDHKDNIYWVRASSTAAGGLPADLGVAWNAYISAIGDQDLNVLEGFFMEDAELSHDNLSFEGREAIVEDYFGGESGEGEFRASITDFDVRGDVVTESGRWWYTQGADTQTGVYTHRWVRQPDGSWKLGSVDVVTERR